MSFSPEEARQLDAIRSHYPNARAASVSVMRWMQRRQGFISDESLHDAADYLGLAAADLESLATFYNLLFRKPVGRHVVKICDSVSCWMCGYEGIRDHLRNRLGIDFGETTGDGAYTLLPVVCLGDCDHAPTMMVDDELHGRLTPSRTDEILAAIDAGKPSARGDGDHDGGAGG